MYIFVNSENSFCGFNVNKQICAQCLLSHANNYIDNNILTNETRQFVENNKQVIISNVKPDDAVFIEKQTNLMLIFKNVKFFKNIADATNSEYRFLKKNIKKLSNINIDNLFTENINTDFHNHNEPVICTDLSSSGIVFVTYNSIVKTNKYLDLQNVYL